MSRSLGAKISGGRDRPWGIFFGFYKTRHILLSNGAKCTVLCAVVLTQYRRVTDRRTDRRTDGRTDGIAIASTALAKRRAVKMCLFSNCLKVSVVHVLIIGKAFHTRGPAVE